MNQLSHQDIVTANLHQFTSNLIHLLPKPVLLFCLSWGDLIIMPLIMVMLRFTLKNIHCNLPLTLYQIRIPLHSNQLIINIWKKYLNYSTQSMMMIFWILTMR